eukprot:SM000176S03119  [mRNA]  locus=s176:29881:34134:- [translate_table: standard]
MIRPSSNASVIDLANDSRYNPKMAAAGGSRAAVSASPPARLLLLLTSIPMFLAGFAFFLQWRGGLDDPNNISLIYESDLGGKFPGSKFEHSATWRHAAAAVACAEKVRQNEPMFPHDGRWVASNTRSPGLKLCITTTTSSSVEATLRWLFYHKTLGVDTYLLFVEGETASERSITVLKSIEGVQVIRRTKELEDKQARSRIWNETWLSSFFYRPCNYELFVRQSLNMEMAIKLARLAGMDWIIHIDTDELLHPAGAKQYSLQQLLGDLDLDVDTVVFPNYETAVEREDVTDPFAEVTMFKKNYDHVTKEVYFGHYREATRNNPNYFLTYGNGKSAARVQDHMRPNGAHRWHNYHKSPKEHKFSEAAVLHYTYARFQDLTSRRDRCGCKPNKEDVKKCFMLDFDREAFIVASTQTEEEMLQWYKEHVVWVDKEINDKLLKKGLLGRIYAPQVIILGIEASGIVKSTVDFALKGDSLNEGDHGPTSVGKRRRRDKLAESERLRRQPGERSNLKGEKVEAVAAGGNEAWKEATGLGGAQLKGGADDSTREKILYGRRLQSALVEELNDLQLQQREPGSQDLQDGLFARLHAEGRRSQPGRRLLQLEEGGGATVDGGSLTEVASQHKREDADLHSPYNTQAMPPLPAPSPRDEL